MKSRTRIEQFHEFAERPEVTHAAEYQDWLKRERIFERMQRERPGQRALWRGIRNAALIIGLPWLLVMWRWFR